MFMRGLDAWKAENRAHQSTVEKKGCQLNLISKLVPSVPLWVLSSAIHVWRFNWVNFYLPAGDFTWTLTSLDLGLWDAFEILGCIGPNWISAHCSQLYKWLCKACWGPAQLEHRSYPCSVGSSASGECTYVRYVFTRFLFIWHDSCVYANVCACLCARVLNAYRERNKHTHTYLNTYTHVLYHL